MARASTKENENVYHKTRESLQLWSERMLATGVIDMEQYNAHKSR